MHQSAYQVHTKYDRAGTSPYSRVVLWILIVVTACSPLALSCDCTTRKPTAAEHRSRTPTMMTPPVRPSIADRQNTDHPYTSYSATPDTSETDTTDSQSDSDKYSRAATPPARAIWQSYVPCDQLSITELTKCVCAHCDCTTDTDLSAADISRAVALASTSFTEGACYQ
jgi:hypothetical protein